MLVARNSLKFNTRSHLDYSYFSGFSWGKSQKTSENCQRILLLGNTTSFDFMRSNWLPGKYPFDAYALRLSKMCLVRWHCLNFSKQMFTEIMRNSFIWWESWHLSSAISPHVFIDCLIEWKNSLLITLPLDLLQFLTWRYNRVDNSNAVKIRLGLGKSFASIIPSNHASFQLKIISTPFCDGLAMTAEGLGNIERY